MYFAIFGCEFVDRTVSKILENISVKVGDKILLESFRKMEKEKIVDWKSKTDYVAETDLKADDAIIDELKQNKDNIPYVIISEERKKPIIFGDKGILYIDPREGTTNSIFGRPYFGVTMGLFENGVPTFFIFYAPYFKEVYKATKKDGAWLNGEKIKIREPDLNDLHIIYNCWEDQDVAVRRHPVWHTKLLKMTGRTPVSYYSDSYDLVSMACGFFSGVVFNYEIIKPWDAVAAFFVEEAGGYATNVYNAPWYNFRNGLIATGSRILHRKLLELLR